MATDVTEQAYETILVERKDAVATVTLNRPAKRNAMNPQLHFEMEDVLDRLAYDPETSVVVITGAGESFSAGMDLKEFFYALDDDPAAKERAGRAAEWRHNLRLHPKPTIAAVNGWCFGGAFTIVSSADIAVAAHEATFGLSEVNFGKIAGGYVSKAISEVLNPRDSIYYVLTGETFDGKRAEEIKFVTKSVPLADLYDTVGEIASTLASRNPVVVRHAKEAIRHAKNMDWQAAGSYLAAKSKALDHDSDATWKRGVEQFKSGEFRPGLGNYEWDKDNEG